MFDKHKEEPVFCSNCCQHHSTNTKRTKQSAIILTSSAKESSENVKTKDFKRSLPVLKVFNSKSNKLNVWSV